MLGTYPTTATSKAEQLADDKAAVTAGAADILNTRTILTITGTFDLPAHDAALLALAVFPETDAVDGDVTYGPNGTEYEGTGMNITTLQAELNSRGYALAATALSNTTWTDARALKLENLDAAITTLPTKTATEASLATLVGMLGGWSQTGVNNVLGAFKALLSKTATAPSDIGGTFSPATDAVEAIRDRGDAAWITSQPPVNITTQQTTVITED